MSVDNPQLLSESLKPVLIAGILLHLIALYRTQPDYRKLLPLALLSASLAIAALLMPASPIYGFFVIPWNVYGLLVLCISVWQFMHRNSHPSNFLIVASSVAQLGSAIWLISSCTLFSLLGYSEPWLSLTATHFLFAGHLLTFVIAKVMERIRPFDSELRRLNLLWFVAVVIPLGFWITAVGLYTPIVASWLGPLVLALGIWVWTLFCCFNLRGVGSLATILGFSILSMSMILALTYALYGSLLDLPLMFKIHGLTNGLVAVPLMIWGLPRPHSKHNS